jgi:glycyl-tRNA synthetase beta chain
MENLLVELCVEELPPKALKKLGPAFAQLLVEGLHAQGLVAVDAPVHAFASPRRLGVHIGQVAEKAHEKALSTKLMPVSVGLDAQGKATPALLKKLGGLGATADAVPTLKRVADGKNEVLVYDTTVPGASLQTGLQSALDQAIAKLPIPKVMGYQLADGWKTVHFVRPVHTLMALHGATVVPVQALGLSAGRETLGHRFEAQKPVVSVRHADSYGQQLLEEGAVIADFAVRRDEIARQLQAAAQVAGLTPIDDEALLDEVTALVERPNVLTCQFEAQYLAVPQECLILTMKANQKYFPLLDAAGKLSNRFLVVSNIRPADASAVIEGNEKVVRPRLADARFFFDTDKKVKLADRLPGLEKVVYHNKLGSQAERVTRISLLARALAHKLSSDEVQAERAAKLAKADLTSNMVGEFPELQGIMGRYYALADGEAVQVAQAIEEHYRPRFAGDVLPESAPGTFAAIADKLETLVGMWSVGGAPTGDRDPFGLRRAALGVLRILSEKKLPLDLQLALNETRLVFSNPPVAESVTEAVMGFMLERLKGMLREGGFSAQEVDAVLADRPGRIDLVQARIEAVKAFGALPEALSLAAANKRIRNILKKSDAPKRPLEGHLLVEEAEKRLFMRLSEVRPVADARYATGDYGLRLTSFLTRSWSMLMIRQCALIAWHCWVRWICCSTA